MIQNIAYKIGLTLFILGWMNYPALCSISGFYPITSIQGLSQNQVRCIYHDRSGFLWIGTQDGLNRYDGYEFKKYARNPFDKNSLVSDLINVITGDANGNLWIGTSAGLCRFDHKTEKFSDFTPWLTHEKNQAYITSVIMLNKDELLVTTLENMYRIPLKGSNKKATWVPLGKDKTRIFKTIYDGTSGLWISESKGLMLYNPVTKTTTNYAEKSGPITDFTIDAQGVLWWISGQKIWKFQPDTKEAIEVEATIKRPLSIHADRFGTLWIGSSGEGLFKSIPSQGNGGKVQFINLTELETTDYSGIDISLIYESDEKESDVLWVGTEAHGLFQFSRSKQSFSNLFPLIRKKYTHINSVYAIFKSGHILYTGTDKGLFSMEQKSNTVKFEGLEDRISQDVFQDKHGNLWVGTNDGLFLRKKGTSTFTIFDLPNQEKMNPSVFKIIEGQENSVLVGTNKALFEIGSNFKTTRTDSFMVAGKKESANAVSSMAIDHEHNIWIGTTKGLFLKKGTRYQKFQYQQNNKQGLIDDLINDIYVSKNGTVWLASPKGLSQVIEQNGTITFRHYSEKQGLENSYVYGILEDKKDRLWLSTNRGLYVFDPRLRKFQTYSFAERMGSDEFNSGAFYKDDAERLYFGGINLLINFDPNAIVQNRHKPQLSITECKIEETTVNLANNAENQYLKIPYTNNVVTIKLAALDFTQPSKNLYAYRIRGLHNEWVDLGSQRVLNLFNLPYRKNVIEFKAANSEGLWNDEEIIPLYIEVIPPFWKQWWFFLLGLGTIVGLAYVYHRMQLNNKLAIERARLEENERVRKMASQDLHDEFGNSLTRITILTEQIKARIQAQKYEEAGSLLTKISDNSSRLYQGTKDFIWSIRTDSDNLFEAITRIKDFADDAMHSANLNFTTSGVSDGLKDYKLPKAASRHLVMILKEAISNTAKHANASHTLLSVEIQNQMLSLIWHDDGNGIQKKTDGNGLDNMKSRSESIGAEISITSSADQGTTIQLTLPIFKNE